MFLIYDEGGDCKLARKNVYTYAVLYGDHKKSTGTMYVKARNAERAVDFVKRWLNTHKSDEPHDKIVAVRGNGQPPAGAQIYNETDIPWNE